MQTYSTHLLHSLLGFSLISTYFINSVIVTILGLWGRKDPGVDGVIICIIKEYSGKCEQDLSGEGQGQVARSCERGNEHSDVIKSQVFLE